MHCHCVCRLVYAGGAGGAGGAVTAAAEAISAALSVYRRHHRHDNVFMFKLMSSTRVCVMVQAWMGQKLVNVTFYEFFRCPIYNYLRLLLINSLTA